MKSSLVATSYRSMLAVRHDYPTQTRVLPLIGILSGPHAREATIRRVHRTVPLPRALGA